MAKKRTDEKLDVRELRADLIPQLQKTQEKYGYLPSDELEKISKELNIPRSRVYGVATFYAQFRFTPMGKYSVKICHGTACHVNGADNIAQAVREVLGVDEGQNTQDDLVSLERVACLGCCSLSPCVMINERVFGKLTPGKARSLMTKLKAGDVDV